MTTKSKRTLVERLTPPREIQEQTKVRRAWLADQVAAKTAEGFEARIVGTGSYQQVSVYRVEEVAGRIQLRGTCPDCGRDQAVVDGRIALHGYQRPGWGSVVGQCQGSKWGPAESFAGNKRAKRVIEELTLAAVTHRKRAYELEATLAQRDEWAFATKGPKFDAARRTYQERRANAPMTPVEQWEDHKHTARSCDEMAKFLEENVLPRVGLPLWEVVK